MPTSSQRSRSKGFRDCWISSEELLRDTAALGAEEIDRLYGAMHSPDSRAPVHELAASAPQSCGLKTEDAPAHLRGAYHQTSLGATSPSVWAPSPETCQSAVLNLESEQAPDGVVRQGYAEDLAKKRIRIGYAQEFGFDDQENLKGGL